MSIAPSLHLAFASDERYLPGLAAALESVLRHSPRTNVHATILDCGIPTSIRDQFIQALCLRFSNLSLKHIPISDEQLQIFVPPSRPYGLNNSTYARILLPELLPDIDRVIFLDSDLIVDTDLSQLFATPLDGNLAGAVPDLNIHTLSQSLGKAFISQEERQLPVFNAGVILMDLAAMRKADLIAPIVDLLPKLQLKQQSQAILNYMLRGRWKALPSRWNRMVKLNTNRLRYRTHHASIWHFASTPKPWDFSPHRPRGLVRNFYDHLHASGWKPPTMGALRSTESLGLHLIKASWASISRYSEKLMLRHPQLAVGRNAYRSTSRRLSAGLFSIHNWWHGTRITRNNAQHIIESREPRMINTKIEFHGAGGRIVMDERVRLFDCTIIVTGHNGELKIGKDCCLRNCTIIIDDQHSSITIGMRTEMAHCQLQSMEGRSITIGENSIIDQNTKISNTDHRSLIESSSGHRLNPAQDVVLEDNVWVGQDCLITKGAILQEGAVLTPRSHLIGTIPANTLAGGSPAKVIRSGINWHRKRI